MVAGVVFSASVSANLAQTEAKLQLNALNEPQSANPLQTYIEVAIPKAPLPLLSSGYMGISPSIHLIRITATRPLSNIDPIENAARRRFGRVDLSFAVLFGLPLAALLICVFISWRAAEFQPTNRLWDYAAEHIALPLSAWFAFCFAAFLSAQYAFGLRLEGNEAFLRMVGWTLGVALYSVFWLALFLYLRLRYQSAAKAAICYAAAFALFTMILPGFLHAVALAVATPEPRIGLTLERRRLTQFNSAVSREKVERLQRQYGDDQAYDALSLVAKQTLTTLAAEEELRPHLDAFVGRIHRFEQLEEVFHWLSPASVTRSLIDDLAGTGIRRYTSFREQAAEFCDQWRKHLVPKLIRGESLDYDDLRNTPKFRFQEEAGSTLTLRATAHLAVLAAVSVLLAALCRKEYRRQKPNATR